MTQETRTAANEVGDCIYNALRASGIICTRADMREAVRNLATAILRETEQQDPPELDDMESQLGQTKI